MCPIVYSYDFDVLQTILRFVSHMLHVAQEGHLFLAIKHNSNYVF
jgi:hypothetical protein